MLKETSKETRMASIVAAEIGGEFEQEISTDLDSLHAKIDNILEDFNSVIEEGKTLQADNVKLDKGLRAGLDDEENYKINAEHIQEERRQEREEKKQ